MTTKENPCAAIVRTQPDVKVTKEIADAIGRDYRVLPVFEKGLFEHTYVHHYSLQRNELLKCRWAKYKREFEDRVFAPFEFLDIRDYHFYDCRTRLLPSLSIHTKTDFRRTLKPGPGVDHLGQMPIPQELLMKRGETNKEKTKGKERKNISKLNNAVKIHEEVKK